MARRSPPGVSGGALTLNSWCLVRSRAVVAPRVGDDGGVLVVGPQLGEPCGQLPPFGPAGLAGDLLWVAGWHADRRAGSALLAADAADAAIAERSGHLRASGSGMRRSRPRSAAAMCGGRPAARSAARAAAAVIQ